MLEVRTCRCICCGLEQDVTLDRQSPSDAAVCARCDDHRADESLRDDDHVVMYRRAFVDAQDETELVRGERDFYRERAAEIDKGAEVLLRTLIAVEELHHDRGGRCCCGESGCAVLRLLADPAVARLLGTYDEQQFTLMELRTANPDAFAREWDYIDVALVHPPRDLPSTGRHRTAG